MAVNKDMKTYYVNVCIFIAYSMILLFIGKVIGRITNITGLDNWRIWALLGLSALSILRSIHYFIDKPK